MRRLGEDYGKYQVTNLLRQTQRQSKQAFSRLTLLVTDSTVRIVPENASRLCEDASLALKRAVWRITGQSPAVRGGVHLAHLQCIQYQGAWTQGNITLLEIA
ncbi:hypothetical protein J6590_103060 [Homalodisca vitripennis]|nr:hypothetical protein J6590_103060 [Homalodisca vitripennis]